MLHHLKQHIYVLKATDSMRPGASFSFNIGWFMILSLEATVAQSSYQRMYLYPIDIIIIITTRERTREVTDEWHLTSSITMAECSSSEETCLKQQHLYSRETDSYKLNYDKCI